MNNNTSTPGYIPPKPVPQGWSPSQPWNHVPSSVSTPSNLSPTLVGPVQVPQTTNPALTALTNSLPKVVNSTTAAPATPSPLPSTPPPSTSLSSALASNPVTTPQNHPGFDPNTNLPNPPPPPVTPPTPSAYDQTLSKISGLNDTLGTKGTVTTGLQNQYGLDQKTQDATTAYNNYMQAKLASDQQIEALRTSSGGLSGSRAQEIDQLTKSNNANLANLAVIAQAASGNLTAAQNIITAKLDAQFKPVQDQIDALTRYAQLNQANLSDSEKAAIQLRATQLQNNTDLLKTAINSAHQFALQQGVNNPAVLDAIDHAQTPADAYKAVGMNSDGSSSMTPGSGSDQVSSLSQTAQGYVDTASDGTPYVSQDRLNNLTAYQKQQLSQEYNAKGIRVLQPGEVQALGTIDEANANLNLFSNTANNLLSPGLLGRLKGFTTNQLAQWTQNNPQWRQFQTLRAGLIKSVQGIAAGAPGLRVTGAELANAAEALPNSADNLESAQQAVKTFQQLLDVNKNILLRKNTGQDTRAGMGAVNNPFSSSSFYGK